MKGTAMKVSTRAATARRALDRRLDIAKSVNLTVPRGGWIRALRDALGMPARYMADRLGVSTPAVYELERSEKAGTIQLNTLRRAADALDCDVVYALVPRRSLDHTLQTAAIERARRDMAAVNQSMRLEDQELNAEEREHRLSEYVAELIRSGDVWTTN